MAASLLIFSSGLVLACESFYLLSRAKILPRNVNLISNVEEWRAGVEQWRAEVEQWRVSLEVLKTPHKQHTCIFSQKSHPTVVM
jgi:hypothetical protein